MQLLLNSDVIYIILMHAISASRYGVCRHGGLLIIRRYTQMSFILTNLKHFFSYWVSSHFLTATFFFIFFIMYGKWRNYVFPCRLTFLESKLRLPITKVQIVRNKFKSIGLVLIKNGYKNC